ncbi:MAG TPA: hypothetical protein VN634_10000 [Candidatus Limnocylindrales bacterium]|nr:hypothetical protein [Candidatus Limnocylindrales bacterium]
MQNQKWLPRWIVIEVAAVIFFSSFNAHATSCPGSSIDLSASPYFGLFELTTDYDLGSGGICFNVSGTGVIDLKGHNISRTGTGAGTAAIYCANTGITIQDTGTTKGTISGTSVYGIANCSTIEGVVIDGRAGYGVYNTGNPLQSLTNTYINADTFGFYGDLAKGSSAISFNNIRATNGGIYITGMADTSDLRSARIERNVINDGKYYQIHSDTDLVDFRSNYLREQNPGDAAPDPAYCIDVAGSPSGDGHTYCDDDDCVYGSSICDTTTDIAYEFPEYASTTACPSNITTNTTLSANYDLAATSGTCLNIAAAGVTIDLNGHTIMNSLSGGTAITCANVSGVTIKDSSSGVNKGGIRGAFANGIINCATIDAVRMDGPDVGVSNSNGYPLAALKNSVITAVTTAADVWMANRNSSTVTNNYLRGGTQGLVIGGVVNSGLGKSQLTNNVVRESSTNPLHTTDHTTSAYAEFKNNLLYRDATPTATGCHSLDLAAYSHLMCACADQCETDDPPILYPLL